MSTNQYNSRWNPDTEEGRKNLAALESVIASLENREGLKTAVKNNEALRDISFTAIKDKLRRESPDSTLGKLWAKCLPAPNILQRLFPDPATRPQAKEDLRTKAIKQCIQQYPQLAGLTKSQLYDLKELLGITTRATFQKKTVAQLMTAIENFLYDRIRANGLHNPGSDELFLKITQEFSHDLQQMQDPFTKERFLEKIEALVWTEGSQGVLTALKEAVTAGVDVETFHKYHPHIPLRMIKEKAEELRGITNILHPMPQSTSFVRGIQRFAGQAGLKGSGKFELPPTSFKKPYEIPLKAKDWEVMHVNGANIGLPHTPLIEENPIRRALIEAEQRKLDAVVMTNIFDIETRKAAGPSRVLQALISGINVNIEALDPEYQEDAKRIIGSWLTETNGQNQKNHKHPELLYQIAAETFVNLKRGLRKIAIQPGTRLRPGKKPEYSGNVYIILGINDERLVTAIAYWEVYYDNLVRQHQLRAERKAIESAIRASKEEPDRSEQLDRQLERIRALEARARITNVTREEWERYYNRALAFFVQSIEDPDIFPNCKVIGKGSTYVKLGEQIVQFFIPSHTHVKATLLSDYTNVYGPKVLRGEMPDMVVISHPYALGTRLTAREADHEGKRRAVKVCVAPICVDTRLVRESQRQMVERPHPIVKAAFSELSSPGVLTLNCIDGVTNITEFPLEALAAFEQYAKKTRRPKSSYNPKYIWIKIATDQHWGAKNKEFVTCHACRVKLGMSDAVFHALRHAGYNNTDKLPPIHVYSANDDPTQGHHFPSENEPHPHELRFDQIEQEMEKMRAEILRAKKQEIREELTGQMVEFALYQFIVRGVECLQNQVMELLKRYLEPNADMFDGILKRAVAAQLTLRGISYFAQAHAPHAKEDRRDAGFITFGTGNHFLRTVDGRISEGPLYAEVLKAQLLQSPFWQERRDLVEQYVKGPTYGKEYISFGTICAPDGYEWGLDFRNTPPGRGVNWGDPLQIAAQNDLRRGNYPRMFEGKVTLKTYGDKHFFSFVKTQHALYLMGPPGTHTDLYGELGFPPNNTGVVFIGLPAEGPNAGPIIIRTLLYDDIRRIVQDNPHEFPWEKFLPNAL